VDADVEADVVVELVGLTTKVVPPAALVGVLVGSKLDVVLDGSIVKRIRSLREKRETRNAQQLLCHRLRRTDDIEIP
jgi:hypothetical protein